MRINPMVKKDIKVQARSMRCCWEIFVYEAIMAVVFFFAMFLFSQQMTYSSANIYSSIVWLYPALAVTQIFILGVVVPVRTASAISGEKERQTFDIMMTTSMTGFSIIMGKVLTAMIQSMFYVVAGLPIVALAFVIGGLSWGNLFWFLAVSLLVSFVSASIGILCSSICKKTISAIILSYGIYVLLFIGSFLPYLVTSVVRMSGGVPEKSCWVLLVNPGMYLLEFFYMEYDRNIRGGRTDHKLRENTFCFGCCRTLWMDGRFHAFICGTGICLSSDCDAADQSDGRIWKKTCRGKAAWMKKHFCCRKSVTAKENRT